MNLYPKLVSPQFLTDISSPVSLQRTFKAFMVAAGTALIYTQGHKVFKQ